MSKIIYTWENLDHDVHKLNNWLKEMDFKPQLIVGIARGGVTPALMLSHLMDVEVKFINWSNRDTLKKDVDLMSAIGSAASYKKVLVIDDIVDTGLAMNQVKHYFSGNIHNVMFTSLWYNPSQSCNVHWWGNIVDRDYDSRFVVFPWELQFE